MKRFIFTTTFLILATFGFSQEIENFGRFKEIVIETFNKDAKLVFANSKNDNYFLYFEFPHNIDELSNFNFYCDGDEIFPFDTAFTANSIAIDFGFFQMPSMIIFMNKISMGISVDGNYYEFDISNLKNIPVSFFWVEEE